MRNSGEKAAAIIGWTIGGFVLSMLALFSLFGGFILALLMMAATPIVLGFLAVEAIFGKKPVYVTSVTTEEQSAMTHLAPAAAQGVSLRVIQFDCICPKGYSYNVGDAWFINGKVEGSAPLCPVAYETLTEYRKRSHSEEEATSIQVSCINGQSVEFEVTAKDAPSLVAAQR